MNNLISQKSNWIGPNESDLEGFSWRGGSERDTTGILMWSEVFVCTTSSGERVIVIVIMYCVDTGREAVNYLPSSIPKQLTIRDLSMPYTNVSPILHRVQLVICNESHFKTSCSCLQVK